MSSKIHQYFTARQRERQQLSTLRALESLREDLAHGELSDQSLLVDEGQAASADQAASLVHELHSARQLDSDATELREVELNANTFRDAVEAINQGEGFTLEDFQFAQRAMEAVFHITPLTMPSLVPSMEGFANGGRQRLALECIDDLIREVADTRQQIENGSIDAIMRVFGVLNETMPEVKSRMESMKLVLPETAYDETAQITLDDTIFKALAVNGAMPTALKDYFASYAAFAKKILAGYSENALETASKASDIADVLTASRNPSIIDALTEFLVQVGDPRAALSPDELGFVLPGSGPLFGGKGPDNASEEDTLAKEGITGELIVRLRQYVASNAPIDPMAMGERPSLEADLDDDESDDEDDEDNIKTFNPDDVDDDADEDLNGDHLPTPETEEGQTEPGNDTPIPPDTEQGAGAEAGGNPDPSLDSGTPTGEEGAAAPGEEGAGGEAGAAPGATDPMASQEAPATSPVTDAATAAAENPAAGSGENLELSIQTSGDAPLDNPLAGAETNAVDNVPTPPGPPSTPPVNTAPPSAPIAKPTMRVLSKDTIACSLTDLIGVFELVNINSFAEARQPTWVAARSSFNRLQQSLMSLSPATVAELRPLLPDLNEYLDVTFTLSAWPALYLLTNAVFTANAFLLLAERSVSGQCESDEPCEGAANDTQANAQSVMPEATPAGGDTTASADTSSTTPAEPAEPTLA